MKKFISILLTCVLMLVPISVCAEELPASQTTINDASSSNDQTVTPMSVVYTYKSQVTGVVQNYSIGYGTEVTAGQYYLTYVGQTVSCGRSFTYQSSYSGNLNGVLLTGLSASVGYSVGTSDTVSNTLGYTVKAADVGKKMIVYAKPILTKTKVTIVKTTYANGVPIPSLNETSYVYTTRITGVSMRSTIS